MQFKCIINLLTEGDRLATLSASEALSRLSSSTGRAITTGLTQLDALLRGKESLTGDEAIPGGFQRGHVTEIYGPPAVGKTALALQAAVNTLREGNAVVWIGQALLLIWGVSVEL